MQTKTTSAQIEDFSNSSFEQSPGVLVAQQLRRPTQTFFICLPLGIQSHTNTLQDFPIPTTQAAAVRKWERPLAAERMMTTGDKTIYYTISLIEGFKLSGA